MASVTRRLKRHLDPDRVRVARAHVEHVRHIDARLQAFAEWMDKGFPEGQLRVIAERTTHAQP